ncbi:MAG TPA: hypothetical protein EYN73_04175 [Chromatiaceae bacterium]|nr:hypothetical protein [Chromatiaceae bacterium]
MVQQPGSEKIIVGSRALANVMTLAKRVAPTDCTILITGESGTGKELVARTVHESSAHANGVFAPLNVAAIPENLLESYLFGHERGAFTGAEKSRDGVFRSAEGGTLFLDEIGELPLTVQPKLLRVPVGSDTPLRVDTRLVVATDRDLKQMVADSSFREDLFYRMNVINIHIPPLRERTEEIPALIDYYIERWSKEFSRPRMSLHSDTRQYLLNHEWLGNVRELAHVMERAVLLSEGDTLMPSDLPDDLVDSTPSPTEDLGNAVDAFKRRHIVNVLDSVEYHRETAAKVLGISAATLYRYIDSYDLQGYGHQPDVT